MNVRTCRIAGAGFVLGLLIGIPGCGSSPEEELSPFDVRALKSTGGFCLYRPSMKERRRVFARSYSHLPTYAGWNYEIRFYQPSQHPDGISFERGDKVVLSPLSEGRQMRLVHTRSNGSAKNDVVLNPEPETNEPRWWRGVVRTHSDGAVDEYFIYSLADMDVLANSPVCKRAGDVGKRNCKILHIEYYDHRDDEVQKFKPTEEGILTDYSQGKCESKDDSVFTLETSEGDGDHGPNRNP